METVSPDCNLCKYWVIKLSFLYHDLNNNNIKSDNIKSSGGHHGHDHIVVRFTTTYAIMGLAEWCLAPLSTETVTDKPYAISAYYY